MKYPLHQSIHNEIMGANFPGSLRNKGTTITEVLHHTVSELEDTIQVLDPPLVALHVGKLRQDQVEEFGQGLMASQVPSKISKVFAFFFLYNSRGRGMGVSMATEQS